MAGFAKAFGQPFEYVIYELSFANLTMYSSVLPDTSTNNKTGKQDDKVIRADNPNNREKVIDLFNKYQD